MSPARRVPHRRSVTRGRRNGDSALDIRFIGLSFNSFERAYQYKHHQHVHQELIFVTDGNYRCTVNGIEITVGPGRLVVLDPGDWHQDFCEPPLRYYGLQILIRRVLDQDSGPARVLLRGLGIEAHAIDLRGGVFEGLLDRIREEGVDMDRFAVAIQESMVREFFWRLIRHIPSERLNPELVENRSLLEARLMQLFAQEIHGLLSVPEMAQALGMSVSSLAHQCRQQLGVSPARAFAQFRMQRAGELLQHSSMTVREISDYLGFENQYHFSRVFKGVYEVAPSQYRELR